MILSLEQIAQPVTRRTATVALPELAGELKLRAWSASQAIKIKDMGRDLSKDGGLKEEMIRYMLVTSVTDESGKIAFTDATAAKFLTNISAETMGALIAAIFELNAPQKKAEDADENPSQPDPSNA